MSWVFDGGRVDSEWENRYGVQNCSRKTFAVGLGMDFLALAGDHLKLSRAAFSAAGQMAIGNPQL